MPFLSGVKSNDEPTKRQRKKRNKEEMNENKGKHRTAMNRKTETDVNDFHTSESLIFEPHNGNILKVNLHAVVLCLYIYKQFFVAFFLSNSSERKINVCCTLCVCVCQSSSLQLDGHETRAFFQQQYADF